jgi:hypothetical protein
MAEEEKNSSQETEVTETAAEASPEEQRTAAEPSSEKEPAKAAVSLNHKRGRMITAGLVTAVIVSLIAVLVAGMFQFGLKWLKMCPTDLPVNDPSPKLWQEMVSQKVTTQSLGVPEKLRMEAQFKKGAPESTDSSENTKAKEVK